MVTAMELRISFLIIFVFLKSHIIYCLAPPYYGIDRPKLEYELPPLEFGFSELEPYMDEDTVRVHYLGHHSKYTEKMNAALKDWRSTDKLASRKSIVAILRNLSDVPETWRSSVKNNGGGFVNHNLFWSIMSPNAAGERVPEGKLADNILRIWGSYDAFRQKFTDQAINLFGSGYVWLCRNPQDERSSSRPGTYSDLMIVTSVNQDSPISDGLYPILVIDVWEHAYYLKHKNMRANYISSWWKLVDWEAVSQLDDWWNGSRFHDEL